MPTDRRSPRPRKPWVERSEDGSLPDLTTAQRDRLHERSMNLCLWHLGQGPRTRHQLATKLASKGVPTDIGDSVLNRLEELGYVNDVQFAAQFTRSRVENSRRGTRSVQAALRSKGVGEDVIADALATVDPDVEAANAHALAQRRATSAKPGEDPRKVVQRIAAFLARRGYPPNIAFTAARDAVNSNSNDT